MTDRHEGMANLLEGAKILAKRIEEMDAIRRRNNTAVDGSKETPTQHEADTSTSQPISESRATWAA